MDQIDYEVRREALNQASVFFGGDSTSTHADVVGAAEAFYGFLTGTKDEPEYRLRTLRAPSQMQRAYEVAPGLFLWAGSRAEAEGEYEDRPDLGWSLPNLFHTLTDEATGEIHKPGF